MDPRNQTVKGQGEVGNLPFPTQAAWICAAKQCSLKYPNPESSFGWAFPNEAQEGTEGTQGPQENEEPLWNDQKTLATGQLKHLFHRPEHSCCSLSHRFNFKYTQYSRKWWNQSHCSLVDTRMDLSVQHHLVDLSKTFHRQHLHSPISAALSSNPGSAPPGLQPLSVISLHELPQNCPWCSPCPTDGPSLLTPQCSSPTSHQELPPWDGRTFGSRDFHPAGLDLLSWAKLHLSLVKSLLSLTASNHQLASLPREKIYPFCQNSFLWHLP